MSNESFLKSKNAKGNLYVYILEFNLHTKKR